MIFTAFSYSDENFTVVGNLCFVHIVVQGTKATYAIPPAIVDRMLVDKFACVYYSYPNNPNTRGVISFYDNISVALIDNGSIKCYGVYDNGYLNFSFPIDSNK